jgi:hypothetical protein
MNAERLPQIRFPRKKKEIVQQVVAISARRLSHNLPLVKADDKKTHNTMKTTTPRNWKRFPQSD